MPEMGILLTREEERRVVGSILDRYGWLVPDAQYDEPVPALVRTQEDYLRWRAKTRLFFVLHDSFLVAPLELRRIDRADTSKYFIAQKTGGPTIDFLSTVEFEKGGNHCVNPGFIAHHRTFWNPDSETHLEPSDALRTFFSQTIDTVKQLAILKKIGVRKYWVGTEMNALLENGTVRLGIAKSS